MKKAILIITLVLAISHLSNSQVAIKWQRTIGGAGQDDLNALELNNDGSFFIGGSSYSMISGEKTENAMGYKSDYWALKLDATGNIQWQNTIGGLEWDQLTSITRKMDAACFLGGFSYSGISGDKLDSCRGINDYWIVELDDSGNIEWQRTIGGDSDDMLFSINQTFDSGYILGGESVSDISGEKSDEGKGQLDYWILKLDSVGSITWQKTIGGKFDDRSATAEQTADGGYIIGGSSESNASGSKTEPSLGFFDLWIVKLNSTGDISWQNTIGGSESDWFESIHQTSDGGYIVGAYSGSSVSSDKTENSLGGLDYWIIRLDASGNIVWQNTIGGEGHDYLKSVWPTTDGGYIAGGTSDSDQSNDKTQNSKGGNDIWIVKLDSAGNIEWDNTFGGDESDGCDEILQIGDREFIAVGTSYSSISGDKTENSRGYTDYWVIRLTETFNLVTGKMFYDLNSNLIQDEGEPSLENHLVKEVNTGRFSFSEQDGLYAVSVLDTGSFSVIANPLDYYTAQPSSYPVSFDSTNEVSALNDFAFQPAGAFNDLAVIVTPLSEFNPGFDALYSVDYSNVGTTSMEGTIVFFPDTELSYETASIVPDLITPDSIVWNTGMLSPFETGAILLTLKVNVNTVLGSTVSSGAVVYPLIDDADTSNNSSVWDVEVTGSFDPNDILVNIHNILSDQLIAPPYLEYIINFQNTGTDTAVNVKVSNKLPPTLNLSSFELMTSTVPVELTFDQTNNKIVFQFSNIMLPDSNVNEALSHGFIRYRIKPVTTLLAGDSIVNNASIFFDFNAAIKTNDAVTYIDQVSGVYDIDILSKHLQVFPNPATQLVTIISDPLSSSEGQLLVYDIYGREIYRMQQGNQKQMVLDVSKFANGIYLILLQTAGISFAGKMIKE